MKFDMNKAWSQAMAFLSSNLGLIATLLGLFYFLPPFAFALLFPDLANPAPPEIPQGVEPQVAFEAMSAAFQEQFSKTWPFMLISTIITYIGAIAVLALFASRQNPTVGDALKMGFKGGIIYLVTQLMIGVVMGLVVGLLLAIVFALLPLLGLIVVPLVLAGTFYILVKTWLVPAVIAIDGELNPIAAIKRSWKLTKGNSLRIFLFLVVLFFVAGLAVLIANLVLTTLFAVFGDPIATIGAGLVSSLSSAVMGGLVLLATAAIHRQLTETGEDEAQTFE